jgi:hypothetical protein
MRTYEQEADPASNFAGGSTGRVLSILGVVSVYIAILGFLALGRSPAGWSASLFFGAIGAVLVVVPRLLGGPASRARRLALTGEKAGASVESVQTTGRSIGGVQQYVIGVRVQRQDGAPPYQTAVFVLGEHNIMPGKTIRVRVDSKQPAVVVLDLT